MESFRVYPHAWLTIAAMMLGRFEVAHSMLRVLSSYHDESTGGFFATRQGRDQRQGPQEIMSTGAAALACLWAGRLARRRQPPHRAPLRALIGQKRSWWSAGGRG